MSTNQDIFSRVAEARCSWHGLYQGRTNAGAHTDPGYFDPDTYGAADWNVRLTLNEKPHFYACGGGPTIESAVDRALQDAERHRRYLAAPVPQAPMKKHVINMRAEETAAGLLAQLGFDPTQVTDILKGPQS